MRNFRAFTLILCVLLLGVCFVGCTSNNDITVTLKFTDAEGNTFWNNEVEVNAKEPTVLHAVNEAGAAYPGLGVTWSDRYELSLTDYPDTQLEDGTLMFWEFTVDGKKADAKATETAIKEGSVIAYVYTAIESTVPDNGNGTDTEDTEESDA